MFFLLLPSSQLCYFWGGMVCCTRELSQLKMSSVENAMSFWLYHALDFSVHGTTGLAVLAIRDFGNTGQAPRGRMVLVAVWLQISLWWLKLQPKGLKSVIKYVHTFLIDFQSRETGLYAGRFCFILLEENLMSLFSGECALWHNAIPFSKDFFFFLHRNLFIDYCMYNSQEVACFFLQSGAKKMSEFCGKVM